MDRILIVGAALAECGAPTSKATEIKRAEDSGAQFAGAYNLKLKNRSQAEVSPRM
jgi:hypothetical protein